LITQASLEKLARRKLDRSEFDRIFAAHRDKIEAIASAKYGFMGAYYPPLTVQPSDFSVRPTTLDTLVTVKPKVSS